MDKPQHSNTLTKHFLFIITKWGFLCAVLVYLYFKIKPQLSNNSVHLLLDGLKNKYSLILLLIAIALMPVNWLFETLKWRYILKSASIKLSIKNAYKSVLAGVAVSLLTPNRMGTFIGKNLYLKPSDKKKGTSLSIYCSTVQLMVTLILGVLSFLILTNFYQSEEHFNQQVLSPNYLFLILCAPSLLLISKQIRSIVTQNVFYKRTIAPYINTLKLVSKDEFITIFLLSSIRYFVFTTQFVFLLLSFGLTMDVLTLYLYISLIYLLLAVVPTLTVAEFGIREVVAINLLPVDGKFGISILLASFTIWIINLVIPAIVGNLITTTRQIVV